MTLLGVSRGSEFSPNMADNDKAIFCSVADNLRSAGVDVECMSERDFINMESEHGLDYFHKYACIFNMARHSESVRLLSEIASRLGVPAVNSAVGLENCRRDKLSARLKACGIPSPSEQVVVLGNGAVELPSMDFPYWLKRGDGCAQVREDVVYVDCVQVAEQAIKGFINRGVTSIVVSEHLRGDLVKFYGVEGTDFFDWGYASDGHSKFGLEAINGKACGFSFDASELKRISDEAARVLDVPVYGGDCVVSEDGTIGLIDFNDWPSFSRCREAASKAIASRILKTCCNG